MLSPDFTVTDPGGPGGPSVGLGTLVLLVEAPWGHTSFEVILNT